MLTRCTQNELLAGCLSDRKMQTRTPCLELTKNQPAKQKKEGAGIEIWTVMILVQMNPSKGIGKNIVGFVSKTWINLAITFHSLKEKKEFKIGFLCKENVIFHDK